MTKRPARILIMDDEERWRDELSEALTDTGYYIRTAATRNEANQLYASELFHVLILDIRMDESDVDNEEGLDVFLRLKNAKKTKSVRVIICSGHDSRYRDGFVGYKAVDFVSKNGFSDDDLRQAVERSLTQKLGVSFFLDIDWQHGLDSGTAVHDLLVDGEWVKRETPRGDQLAAELDDLLCRLFHDAQALLIEPLTKGCSGAGVLLAQPNYAHGGVAQKVVVKYGDSTDIDLEFRNFREHVQPYLGGQRHTTGRKLRHTPRLGGALYSFVGTSNTALADFETFYEDNDLAATIEVLDDLFRATCAGWYANMGNQCFMRLTQYYSKILGLQKENLEQARSYLKSVQGHGKLAFNSLDGVLGLPNPISVMLDRPWTVSTYECVTHGDLNANNIFVDHDRRTWLIDFQRTGRGHVLRDVIQLDNVIRFELLTKKQAPLQARFELERALLAMRSYPKEGFPIPETLKSPAVRKAFGACCHLRFLAGRMLSNNRNASLEEYYIGSAFLALGSLKRRRLARVCREHALLSAALLAQQLGG